MNEAQKSTVAAIVLNYFGSDKTARCLRSLKEQGLDSVLVVDNSADQQAFVELRQACDDVEKESPGYALKCMENTKNLGFARGMNEALRWLKSNRPHRYYLLLNNDAYAEPSMVGTLVRYLEHHREIGVVAPLIQSSRGVHDGLWYHRATGLTFSRPFTGAFHYRTGCCLLLRGDVVEGSLFDEDFFMYGEDVEYNWRLQCRGVRIATEDGTSVHHEGAGSSHQGELFYEYHMVRGHLLLAKKTAIRRWEAPIFLGCRAVVLSLRATLRAFRYRSLAPLKGLLLAAAGLRI